MLLIGTMSQKVLDGFMFATVRRCGATVHVMLIRTVPFVFGCGLERVEMLATIGEHLEDTSHVSTTVTVIWRAPYG